VERRVVWVLGSAVVHWGAVRGREIILGMDLSICPFVKKNGVETLCVKGFRG
jgi:hypothetical protein